MKVMTAMDVIWWLVLVPTPVLAGSDGDDFANNLFSALGPLLALFGERVGIQYLSHATSWMECVIFALETAKKKGMFIQSFRDKISNRAPSASSLQSLRDPDKEVEGEDSDDIPKKQEEPPNITGARSIM
ncbi:hypothetical protein QBC38DRAFT_502615 [Podospora fimiseda]|uniref:Uncharacterized protein n=1 Tax=Podospora fimiseda TaxID=252190 RepID=A0AAN7GWD1_9PEZI|nr:hypothetical protein QBC38DRAFT_502615 [Podospora fimiseda]